MHTHTQPPPRLPPRAHTHTHNLPPPRLPPRPGAQRKGAALPPQHAQEAWHCIRDLLSARRPRRAAPAAPPPRVRPVRAPHRGCGGVGVGGRVCWWVCVCVGGGGGIRGGPLPRAGRCGCALPPSHNHTAPPLAHTPLPCPPHPTPSLPPTPSPPHLSTSHPPLHPPFPPPTPSPPPLQRRRWPTPTLLACLSPRASPPRSPSPSWPLSLSGASWWWMRWVLWRWGVAGGGGGGGWGLAHLAERVPASPPPTTHQLLLPPMPTHPPTDAPPPHTHPHTHTH